MKLDELQAQLNELKRKQEVIAAAWKKRVGNKELLDFLVHIMPKVLDAERCSIFILDPFHDNVWVQAGTGLKEKQVSVPRSGSLAGQVIASGKPMIEHDMQNLVGTHDIIAAQTGFVTRNAICVPVKGVTRKQVTGAIQVLNKKDKLRFTKEDQEVLEELALLLQVNIENIFIRQELSLMLAELKGQISNLEQNFAAHAK